METLKRLNQKRTAGYRKDEKSEDFLVNLNDALLALELDLVEQNQKDQNFPLIFVYGCPRAGTTLTTQLIARGLQVGYMNNLSARFWKAPNVGVKLSHQILGRERKVETFSHFGQTDGLNNVHDFGYFWRKWLHMENVDSVCEVESEKNKIDWTALSLVTNSLKHEFQSPVVMKNILGAHHFSSLNQNLGPIIWVRITRDEIDNAISIVNAREKFYDDRDVWWSCAPPEFHQLAGLSWNEQISGQVYYLNKFYDSLRSQPSSNRIIEFNYQKLCSNPEALLHEIISKAEGLYNFKISMSGEKIEPLEQREYRDHPDRETLRLSFKAIRSDLE